MELKIIFDTQWNKPRWQMKDEQGDVVYLSQGAEPDMTFLWAWLGPSAPDAVAKARAEYNARAAA